MSSSRRQFLQSAAAAGALSSLSLPIFGAEAATRPLRLLILGGTGFIGPHEINYALERGHKITMFNRGKTAPDMFPSVERLIGDRNGQLDSLKGREWDAVIDNSGFFPRHARLSAELLKGNVGRYLFVSSISAYGQELAVDHDEFTAPPAQMPGPVDESEYIYGPTYGARKRLCEEAVSKVFGDDAILVRPGIITGPGDPTNRLRHWLVRLVAGKEILVPGAKDWPVQYIDARDLSAWMLRLVETGASGPFNAVGAEQPYAAQALLNRLKAASNSNSTYTWVDWPWLNGQFEKPPRYTPWFDGEFSPFMQVNNDRALATGLTFMPIEQTARDMIAKLGGDGIDTGRGEVSLEKEAALLKAWHARDT